MANSTKVNVGLKNAQERLTLAQERLTLVKETQDIYNSIFADDRALMPRVIKLASLKSDNTVILSEIELDEALENLRLVEREHFVTGDDGDDGDADDVDGYDVEGFNVHGYDIDSNNVYGIPAFTIDMYEYIE